MKKKLIFICILVLIATLILAACKNNNDVKFICEDLTIKVGEKPNFSNAAKLTVDGVEKKDFEVRSELKNGDPSKVGECIYSVSVDVNGVSYSVDVVVTYTSASSPNKNVVISVDNFSIKFGSEIDWNSRVTVTNNGSVIQNPELRVTLESGNENKEGVCRYRIVCTVDGVEYEKIVQVNYTKGTLLTEAEQEELNSIFAKEYEAYSFEYKYERGNKTDAPDTYAFAQSVEKIEGMKAFISYSDEFNDYEIDSTTGNMTPVHDALSMEYYWEQDSTHFKHTFKNDQDVWFYVYYDIANVELLEAYLPNAFQINEYGWDATDGYFEKLGDNLYRVGMRYLDTICNELLGELKGGEYTEMQFTVEDGNITELNVWYVMQNSEYDEYECVITYKWGDFDETTVNVPEASDYRLLSNEHFVSGNATELTSDEQTALTDALSKEYESVKSGIQFISGSIWELTCNYSKQGGQSKAYIANKVYYAADGEVLLDDLVMVDIKYFSYDIEGAAWVFEVVKSGDYEKYKLLSDSNETTTTDQQIANSYLAANSLGLTADMFAKLGDKYVIKSDKLGAAYEAINEAFVINDNEDKAYSLVCGYATLDAQNNVTCVACIIFDESARAYETLLFTYAGFDNTEILMPTERNLQALTSEQQTALSNALSADVYSNVTLVDSFDDTFKYDGDNVTAVEVIDNRGNTQTTQFVRDNGKWYLVKGDNREELTGETPEKDFTFLCLYFDLSRLAQQSMQYDADRNQYYVALTDEAVIEIAKYYSNYAELYDEDVAEDDEKFGGFTGIGLTLNDDGTLASISVYSNEISFTTQFIYDSAAAE